MYNQAIQAVQEIGNVGSNHLIRKWTFGKSVKNYFYWINCQVKCIMSVMSHFFKNLIKYIQVQISEEIKTRFFMVRNLYAMRKELI